MMAILELFLTHFDIVVIGAHVAPTVTTDTPATSINIDSAISEVM